MSRLWSILLWSVIAAAFIGPGTVTTAAAAGHGYGLALLWALAFSTVACLVLQEASARLTAVSGRDLGQALRWRYHGGVRGLLVLLLVLGAIVVGCAAYEAGNILGGVAGARLGFDLPASWLTLGCAAVAAALLWPGRPAGVAKAMSALVAVMGIAFLATAVALRPDPVELLRGTLVPALPPGSGLLMLGLVGTTVVPYNLFLGSGLARGQELSSIRLGLAVAVVLGGLISMAVVVVGTAVQGSFSFDQLAAVLETRLGPAGRWLLASGLLAAGLSSAITAPLAAALTARSLFAESGDGGEGGAEHSADDWHPTSWRFRAVWGAVLATGVVFGVSGVQPIPVIVLAQALNGLLLPLVAVFLLLAVNDRRLMGESGLNGPAANLLLTLVVLVTLVLGALQLTRAASRAFGAAALGEGVLLIVAAVAALVLAVPVGRAVVAGRR